MRPARGSLSLSVSSTVPAALMQNTRSPEGGKKEAGDGKEAGDEGATGAKLSQVEASHFYLLAHTLHIMCQAWGRGSRGSGRWQAGGRVLAFFCAPFSTVQLSLLILTVRYSVIPFACIMRPGCQREAGPKLSCSNYGCHMWHQHEHHHYHHCLLHMIIICNSS